MSLERDSGANLACGQRDNRQNFGGANFPVQLSIERQRVELREPGAVARQLPVIQDGKQKKVRLTKELAMIRNLLLVTAVISVFLPFSRAQEKPTIVVHNFSKPESVPCPYDMKQLQLQTIAELQRKDGNQFTISADASAAGSYALDGEILEWHPGNRATRLLVGMGSGRETAKIHYWLSNAGGKRVFEHTDTIRAAFWGNEYAGSVGQLAQPFADKIAERLAHAKLR